jgi:transcriptional regulator with XRE-family HTH domain
MGTQQFGQRIRAIRQERGISQNALAKAAGITQGTLSKAEAGERSLSVEIIDKLAVALGKEPRSLVEGTDAEGKYTAERVSPEEIQSYKANKATEIYRNLSLLHLLYGQLYGLCSAIWSHGIGSGDPLHEVVRENISEACEPVLNSLERLGYEEIRTKVQIPSAILDEPGTLPECAGETWEYEIEPSLVAGEPSAAGQSVPALAS